MHHTIEGIRYSKYSDRGIAAKIAYIVETSCSKIGLWTLLIAAAVSFAPLLVVSATQATA